MTKKGKKAWKKEDYSEEWCFVCKDGGDLIICEHKDCLKSYHPECVDSSANSKKRFICDLHKCEICSRSSDFRCYCCPKSVCGRCIKSADFVHIKGKQGFCEHCLKLALLVEEKKDVDSDGETIDFNNRNTYETLYKEYWEIINTTEKLTLETLTSAKAQLKSGKNYDSDNYEDSDEYQCSDSEEKEEIKPHDSGKKKKKIKPSPEPSEKKRKTKKSEPKSKKKEFSGWGSTSLMQFLKNIGKETINALSQRELEKIIKIYCKEKDLLQKNKTVECDVWLQSIFGRKTVKINRIYDLLEIHLAENQVSSDEDDLGYDSEDLDDEDEDLVVLKKKKKKNNEDNSGKKKEGFLDVSHFHFASVVPQNIRLVYLKKSLVQKFEKEPETFESKVIGSFVRVKQDSNGGFLKTYQLMQVTGVKKCTVGETYVLQSSETEICISSLSDDDFSDEECQDLKLKVKSGLLKKLTVVELEEKAKNLRKDIIGHWIPRELSLLKHRIDQANEKGWRKELFEYLDRRQFLQNPTNQTKLLEEVPTVVPDIEETGPLEDDKKESSPKSILTHSSSGNFNASEEKERKQQVPAIEKYAMAMKLQKFFGSMELQVNSKRSSVVKNPTELFEASEIDLTKEELEDTESSQWYIKSPDGEKVGPVSLSVLKIWSQSRAASESKIYKTSQDEEKAMPLTAVLRLAFK